jgi:hypothetical protein
MANGFRVRIESAVSDGTNIFLVAQIKSPTQTYELIRPVFKVGTTAAAIDTYMQAIADNGPVLATAISDIVGKNYVGA